MRVYEQEDLEKVIQYIHKQYSNNNSVTRNINAHILDISMNGERKWTNADVVDLLERQLDMSEIFHTFATAVEAKFIEMLPTLVSNDITSAILRDSMAALYLPNPTQSLE